MDFKITAGGMYPFCAKRKPIVQGARQKKDVSVQELSRCCSTLYLQECRGVKMKKRTNKACRLLVVPAMMLAGLSGLCDAGDNLVPNAGFEKTQEGNLAGWTQPNDLTIMWEKGGVTGRCLHFDTDVYLRQWKEKQKNPEADLPAFAEPE